MNTLYLMLINTIIIIFPLIINLFYYTYSNTLKNEYNKAFFDFSLLTSLYLAITYNKYNPNIDTLMLLNIPLILSYMKDRKFISIILSIFIVITYSFAGLNIILYIIEYIVFYILSYAIKKKINFLHIFCLIKLVSNIIFYHNLNHLLVVIIFILITDLIIFMYKKGEDLINLHMNYKELEKEKQIRMSLFKITHEIKNPIAVCKSYLDMFDINNKEHEKYIEIIKEEINQILLLLHDFLSMNKIKINKELLDINLLLEDVSGQFNLVLNEKNIKFKSEFSSDEIIIEGDYNRLNQVLINIIKNSVESLENKNNGSISIKTKVDKDFKIIIEDNGIGISEEDLKKIKEPFYTTKKNGTGLGVSLSYEIINAHNGNLNYESIIGIGTKVIISLPIYEIFT